MGHSVKLKNGPQLYFPDGMKEPEISRQIYSYRTGKDLAPGIKVVFDDASIKPRVPVSSGLRGSLDTKNASPPASQKKPQLPRHSVLNPPQGSPEWQMQELLAGTNVAGAPGFVPRVPADRAYTLMGKGLVGLGVGAVGGVLDGANNLINGRWVWDGGSVQDAMGKWVDMTAGAAADRLKIPRSLGDAPKTADEGFYYVLPELAGAAKWATKYGIKGAEKAIRWKAEQEAKKEQKQYYDAIEYWLGDKEP